MTYYSTLSAYSLSSESGLSESRSDSIYKLLGVAVTSLAERLLLSIIFVFANELSAILD